MLKREECAECGVKISSADIRDGLAREHEGKIYCRKCILDLGLLVKRASETESFLDGVKGVLGELELSRQETVQVERKTRKQVAVLIENIIQKLEDHPSWGREDILRYIRSLM